MFIIAIVFVKKNYLGFINTIKNYAYEICIAYRNIRRPFL